jgi:hypothetical protein
VERADGSEREPFSPWLAVNAARLVIYLLIASFGSSAFLALLSVPLVGTAEAETVTVGSVFGFGLFSVLVGGLGSLPGAIIWLLIVSRLSTTSSVRRRRTIAALTAPPLIGIAWIVLFSVLAVDGDAFGYVLASLYGVIFPAGSAWVIRLRGTREDVEARIAAERHPAPGF